MQYFWQNMILMSSGRCTHFLCPWKDQRGIPNMSHIWIFTVRVDQGTWLFDTLAARRLALSDASSKASVIHQDLVFYTVNKEWCVMQRLRQMVIFHLWVPKWLLHFTGIQGVNTTISPLPIHGKIYTSIREYYRVFILSHIIWLLFSSQLVKQSGLSISPTFLPWVKLLAFRWLITV